MKNIICLIILSVSTTLYSEVVDGYDYGMKIEINNENVFGPGNHLNFPVLFHFTNDALKSVENGGNIHSNEGWDIIFTSDDCETQLSHQVESYDPVFGELICWIKIPVLNSSENTTIHIVYGNSLIDGSTESEDVWENEYRGVYHFDELDDVADYSAFGNTAENHSVENSIDGKLLGARVYNDLFDYVEITSDGMDGVNGTVSLWVKPELFSIPSRYIFGHTSIPSYDNRIQIYTGHWDLDSNSLNQGFGESHLLSTEMTSLNADEWVFVSCSWNSNDFITRMYVDGEEISATEYSGLSVYGNVDIGNNGSEAHDQGFYGLIDEVHIANTERSAGWIKTEYNNQNNAEGFAILTEQFSIEELCGTEVEDSTGVDLIESNDISLNIYPNPVNEYLIIELNGKQFYNLEFKLTSVLGAELDLINVESVDENRFLINTDRLANGIYYLYVVSEFETVKKSFIVSH